MALFGREKKWVFVALPAGGRLQITVASASAMGGEGMATVIKDAGDDPDITHGARIGARVALTPGIPDIVICGGKGVGRVTRPGLEIPPGEPAINPVPRKMIAQSVALALAACGCRDGVRVEIFVENGEMLARKTLNRRLGIEGGLSILGTTGIVKPLSHEAYAGAIRSALSVARACGADTIALATGRRTETFAQRLFPDLCEQAFVQIGDFFQFSLQQAADFGFSEVRLAVFFGKALKMAQGFPHTHAASSSLTLDWLGRVAYETTSDENLEREILSSNTARRAFGLVYPRHPEVMARVAAMMTAKALDFGKGVFGVRVVIFDFNGCVALDAGPVRETSR